MEAEGEAATRVAGSFEVTEGAAFELSVTDVEGLESTDKVKGRVTVKPDRPPLVDVLEPGRHALAADMARAAARVVARQPVLDRVDVRAGVAAVASADSAARLAHRSRTHGDAP